MSGSATNADLSCLCAVCSLVAIAYCCCPSNPHINSPSHPRCRQFLPDHTANTAIMRYSTLLMIAASVFVVAQDTAEPSSQITSAAEPSNTLTGLAKEQSRASAMEESQRSAASVAKTATSEHVNAEVSRASAMEASQRSAASVAKTATSGGGNAEVSRAAALESSQRSAASVAKTATTGGGNNEVARASALEASQRAAAQSDKENAAPMETGFPSHLVGAAGLALAALL